MLDDKKIERIKKRIPLLLNEGEISKEEANKQLVPFYTENSLTALNTARILNKISTDTDAKKQFKFIDDNFESCLWVINSAYYSMFYMAGALLAKIGIKIKSEIGIHNKTLEALAYYFYLTNKLAKSYLEDYEEIRQESQELLQNKAKELMDKYDSEMSKRAQFTYNIGLKAKQSKATTSLNRAIEFYNEGTKILAK